MSERREFGSRYHFEGDGCDPGKCPKDRELPYPPGETIAEALERIDVTGRSPYLERQKRQKLYRGSSE